MLQGMSDSPTSVSAMGLSTNVTKLIVFCISAFLAGLAGVLLGATRIYSVGGDPYFQPFFSLLLLAMLALAPFAEPWFGLVALTGVIPAYIEGSDAVPWLNVFFGFFAVQVAMAGGTPAMPARLQGAVRPPRAVAGRRRPGRPTPGSLPSGRPSSCRRTGAAWSSTICGCVSAGSRPWTASASPRRPAG